MKATRTFTTLFLFLFAFAASVRASHVAGGEFEYQHIGGDTFLVTLHIFQDCGGSADIGDVDRIIRAQNDCGVDTTFNFVKSNPGGTEVSLICPTQLSQSECNGGTLPGVERHSYSATLVLDTCDEWTFTHGIFARNTSINGVGTSGDDFIVDAVMRSATDSTNSSATFTNDPIPYVCINQPITYNVGGVDADGDSLHFSLVAAKDISGFNANNSAAGQSSGTLTTISYAAGLSGANPISGITLNGNTGEMTFTPTATGNLILALRMDEYDSFSGDHLGYVIRDMQVVVINCTNTNPTMPDSVSNFLGSAIQTDSLEITANQQIGVNPADSFCIDLLFFDPDGDTLTITSNAATVLPGSSVNTTTIGGPDSVLLTLCWQATAGLPTNNTVVFTAVDSACPVASLNSVALNVIVPQTPTLTVGISTTDITCNGLSNGSASLNISGSGNYSINWAPCNPPCSGQGNDTVTNLSAGGYSVFVQDLSLLQDTLILFSISEPSPIITIPTITTDPSCALACDGAINLFSIGGFGTISPVWSTGATTSSISGLCGGTYTVTVTDDNGCTALDRTTMIEPPAVIVRIDSTDSVSCNGGSDGQAFASAFGGAGSSANTNSYEVDTTGTFMPYGTGFGTTVVLSDDQMSTAQAIGFSFDFFGTTYNSFYISSNGFISFSAAQSSSPTVQTIPDAGSANNLIAAAWTDLDPSLGGTIEYYTTGTSPNQILVVNFINVPHGSGVDPITSQIVLFETSDIIQIHTTTKPNISATTMGIEDATGATAHFLTGRNNTNYAITDEFMSFIPPKTNYTFAWPSGGSNATEGNLAAGTYCVTVTDNQSCTQSVCATILEPTAITLTLTEVVPIDCPGDMNGSAAAAATGGTGTITFAWDIGQNTDTAINLGAGTYVVTATDANACTVVDSITLADPPAMTLTPAIVDGISCFGESDGTVTMGVTGGTNPYTFLWDDPTLSTNDTVFTLADGTYRVTVTDNNGCTAVDSVTLVEPTLLTVTASGNDPNCAGELTGEVSAVGNGGTLNYSFAWTGGLTGTPVQNLGQGTYTVTITDANGCTATDQVTITDPPAITLSLGITNTLTCNGDDDGEITATTGGGTGGFSFLWSDGQTSNPAIDLVADTYTVTITDANGCTDTETIVLSQPSAIGLSIAQTANILCVGDSNGQITANTTGGTGAIAFLWSNGQTTNPATNLHADTYTVTATDDNGCTETQTLTISDPAAIVLTPNVIQDVSCNGGSDGSGNIGVAGGTSPFSFLWDDPAITTNDTVTGLSIGTYRVTVTDNNGCTAVDSIAITQPTVLSVTASGNDPNCAGELSGEISAVGNGGTPNYTFAWTGGLTGSPVQNLGQGTYTVTITDANGCTATDQVTISDPAAITLSLAITNTLACNGDDDGEITATTGGGTGGFSFLWSDGQTSNPAIDLVADTYTVTITDANGCTDTETIVLSQPSAIGLSITQTANILCLGDSNGAITANTTGGTGAITFLWSNGQTTNPATNLHADTYTVTATDANGCTEAQTLIITDPAAIVLTPNVIQDVSCNGGTDGSGNIGVAGGTAPYTFLWNDPANTTNDTVSNLSVGTYIVTVTDNNGCTAVDSITVTQPNALSVIASGVDPNCAGDSTGQVSAAAIGGTLNYSFAWTGGFTNATVPNLPQGTYTVTVTDANGCTATDQVTISDPAAITLSLAVTNTLDCSGDNDGEITATTGGGAGGFSFNWSGGPNTNPIIGLTADTYTVTVTDASGCTAVDSIDLTQPTLLSAIALEAVAPSCSGGACDGEANAFSSGGTGAVTFSWNTTPVQTGATATSLCPDSTYIVTATDANGCTATASVTMSNPSPITLTLDITDSLDCFGDNNAEILVATNGGVGPFGFNWNTGPTTNPLENLTAATYTVTVTDGNGCTVVDSIEVTQPTLLTVLASGTDPNCAGDSTGQVSAVGNGGTLNYTFAWPGGNTGATVNNLPQGSYTVTITDGNGCTAIDVVTLTDPPALTLSVDVTDSLDCNGDINAEITAIPGGGTPGYTLVWSGGLGNNNPLTNLGPGTYTVTITDFNGCTIVDSVEVVEPALLVPTAVESSVPSCAGGTCDGEATVSSVGGTGAVTFSWNTAPIQVGATATNLCPDSTYVVTATDANGCTAVDSVTISNPTPITLALDITDSLDCFGDSTGVINVTPTGGSVPFTFLWNTGSTDNPITGLPAGTYTVTATDDNGCTAVDSIEIINPPVITLSLAVTDSLDCFGDNDGEVTATAAGGTGSLTLAWNVPQAGNVINSLSSGNYIVTVTDDNGCTLVDSIEVIDPPQITLNLVITDSINCFGGFDGEVTATVGGGTGALGLAWSNGPTTNVNGGLGVGTYILTVTDANGCTAVDSAELTQPTPITATLTINNGSSCNVCDGSATLAPVSGGNGGYTFAWSNLQDSTTADSLCPGLNSVTITDQLGCDTTISLIMPSNGAETITAIDDVVSCVGLCDGEVIASYVCNDPPCTAVWTDLNTLTVVGAGDTLSGLCAGDYLVEVTNNSGCVAADTAFITSPPALTLSLSVTNALDCNGDTDGEITATAGGGTGNLSFAWDGGQNVNVISNLGVGNYIVTVTDDNGCTIVDSLMLTEPAAITALFTNTLSSCTSCTGTSTIIPGGGDGGPYTVVWDNADSGPLADTLCPGAVNVTVTDNSGCSEIFTTAIQNATTDTIDSVTVTSTLCNGSCDGTAVVHYSCATCTVEWFDNGGTSVGTTDTIIGLCAGNYSVEITNASSCVSTELLVIAEPSVIVANSSFTDPSCFNTCDGTASVNPAGGTGAYTYLWSPMPPAGQGTAIASGLCEGSWQVVVTDANNCTDTTTFNLVEPADITATINTLPSSCTVCTGAATILGIAGGNGAPYTMLWDNGDTGIVADSLCPGTHTVTVTDNSTTCDTIMSFLVGNSGADLVTAVDDTVSCFGSCDGELIATYVCTDPPCQVSWVDLNTSTIIGTTDTVSNLCPGSYEVTLTNNSGCADIFIANVAEPTQVSVSISINDSITCHGGSDGELIATATGGTGTYNFVWSDNQLGNIATGLDANTYIVTAIDANGCTAMDTLILTEPGMITATFATTPSSCTVCDGVAIASPAGGNGGPYTYAWGSGPVIDTAQNLCAGLEQVTIFDSKGCPEFFSVAISNIGADTLDSLIITDVSCNNDTNGTAIAFYVCNDPPCQVTWIDLGTLQTIGTNDTVMNLGAGNYSVELSNATGCIEITSFVVNEPPALLVTPSSIDPLCFGDANGSAWVDVTGGTPNYAHIWSPAPGFGQGTDSVSGLTAGTWTVFTQDANGCSDTTVFTLTNPAPVSGTFSGIVGSGCTVCDGDATVNPVGGTGPYTFLWSSNETTQTADSLCGGFNNVTVTDANGCDSVLTINIPVIGGDPVSALVSDASCSGTCDGVAIAVYTCGTPPCTVQWTDMGTNTIIGTTDTIMNLCAGSYLVEVTNGSGCVTSDIAIIGEPDSILPNEIVTNVSCFGATDGSIVLTPTGGDGNFSYVWSPTPAFGQGSAIVSGLTAGLWSVTITDGNGCDTAVAFNVIEPTVIIPNGTVADLQCANVCDGNITLAPTGGSGGYSYNWSPTPALGQGTNVADSLCAGTYFVTVTDQSGCTALDTFVVNQSQPIVLDSANVTASNCNVCDGTIEAFVTGGTGPLTYFWSPNPTVGQGTNLVDSLCAGLYTLTVTDSLGCQEAFVVPLSDSAAATVNLSLTDASCFGSCDGTAKATLTGGTAPFLFTWTPGLQSTDSISGLCAGQYGFVALDAAGCTTTDTFSIQEPPQIQINMQISLASCNDSCTGSIEAIPSAGVAPYTYNWSTGATDSVSANLCPGTYLVTVTDANGCTAIDSATLVAPTAFVYNTLISDISCNGSCDGQIVIVPVTGTAPYSFTWSTGDSTNSVTDLCAGTYSVIIADAGGCSDTANFDFFDPPAIVITLDTVMQPDCGTSNGSATVSATGGTPFTVGSAYLYNWLDVALNPVGQTGNTLSNVSSSIYFVEVSDSTGCSDTMMVIINDSSSIEILNATVTNMSCAGVCDGAIDIDLDQTNGPPFSILWSNGQTSEDLTNLCAGLYAVQTTDSSGCNSYGVFEITEPDSLIITSLLATDETCGGSCDGTGIVAVTGGSPGYTYNWSNGTANDTVLTLCAGTHTITVTDAANCTVIDSVVINGLPPIQVTVNAITNTTCENTNDGGVNITVSGGTPGFTYQWVNGADTSDTTALEDLSNIISGTYFYTITDANNCEVSDSVVVAATTVVTARSFGDSTFCDNQDSILLQGRGLNGINFQWTDTNGQVLGSDSTVLVPFNNDSMFYVLTVSSGLCFASDTVLVTQRSITGGVDAGPNQVIITGEGVTTIPANLGGNPTGPTGSTYNWFPSSGLNGTDLANPTAEPLVSTTYYVEIVGPTGCTALDSVFVEVREVVDVPSGFSPNGDGVNDGWVIDFIDEYPEATVEIYNRWGQLLFRSVGYTVPWDGTYEGNELPVGTYYYIIDLKDSEVTDPFTGPITIMR